MVEKAAASATYIGSGSAIVFGLTANDLAALIGASVAVIGLIVNIWFKHQHLKLAKERSQDDGNLRRD